MVPGNGWSWQMSGGICKGDLGGEKGGLREARPEWGQGGVFCKADHLLETSRVFPA